MENKKTVSKEHSKMRLDKVSTIIFEDFSRTQIKKWILEGRVFLNDDIASPRDLVHEGDSIQIDPITEEKISWVPEEIDIDVIYENDEIGVHHSIVTFNDGNVEAVMAVYKYKDGKIISLETGATPMPK